MEIVKAPDRILSQPAKPVATITKPVIDIIEAMQKTLLSAKEPEGVGIAAPQIGKPLRIFIMKPTPTSPITVFINPQVTVLAELTEDQKPKPAKEQLEGCLSLRNIWGTVKRAPKVTVTYQDELGKEHTKTFIKFSATIIQHEFDHLNGILFPKRVLEQNGTLYKSKKDKNGKEIFEELDL